MYFTLMGSCGRYHILKLFLAFISVSMVVNVLGNTNPTRPLSKFGLQHSVQDKSIVKTFQMGNDIIDCFDIYKQPGLNHPGLQGQRSQIESIISHDLEAKNSSTTSNNPFECPARTVPIRRMKGNESTKAIPVGDNDAAYMALLTSKNDGSRFRGFRASFSVHQVLDIEPIQETAAIMWITSLLDNAHDDRILAGWTISKHIYGDEKPRLTINYNVNGRPGCYNLQCPGFILVSERIIPGMILPYTPATGGPPQEITLTIVRETKRPRWTLYYDREQVGFWPSNIFTYMADTFTNVAIGGEAESTKDLESPPMGSGKFPSEGKKRAAYISNMQVAIDRTFVSADAFLNQRYESDPDCYKVSDVVTIDSQPYVFYGGPGGCTLN